MFSHHDTLTTVGEALGLRWAFYWRGGHHFPLDPSGDWTLAVHPESARRIRLETCHLGRVRGTKWCLEGQVERLARLALEARDEVLAEV